MAERANLAKSTFLAAASHDLRQPLAGTGASSPRWSAACAAAVGLAIVSDIQDCIGSMGRLLNALLDISQLEAGTIAPSRTSLHLRQIFDLLLREHMPSALAKKLELRAVASDAVVDSDPTLLRTILANLLSNAIRYTPSGRILIGCRRRPGNRLSIEVHDRGIGIPDDQIAKYSSTISTRSSSTVTDRSLGLGLGLAIARRLADLLGHGISVRSVPGRGSSFALMVPLGAGSVSGETAEPPRARQRSLANRTILILENDPTVSLALAAILRDWGAVAVEAATIEAALDSLAAATPDIVIADYQLDGGENGIEALDRLQARLRRRLPAILLSGDMAPADLRRMRDSGHYILSKPTQPGRLRALLNICLKG